MTVSGLSCREPLAGTAGLLTIERSLKVGVV